METIFVNDVVNDNGIFLKPELFSGFRNSKVQIIIRQIEDNPNHTNIMKFAGVLEDDEALILNDSVKECRKIDDESW
jgi:hypothetical protein